MDGDVGPPLPTRVAVAVASGGIEGDGGCSDGGGRPKGVDCGDQHRSAAAADNDTSR